MRPQCLLIFAFALTLGCKSKPEQRPLPLPPAALSVTHYAGTPLSGPRDANVAEFTPDQAWSAKVTFVALEAMPSTAALEPISTRVRLVSAARSGVPVVPSGRLTQGVRLISLDVAARFMADLSAGKYGEATSIATMQGALPPGGVTAEFIAADVEPIAKSAWGSAALRQIAIDIARPPASTPATAPSTLPLDQVQISISVDDLLAANASAQPAELAEESSPAPTTAPVNPPVLQSERALLDPIPIEGQQQFALFIPFRFDAARSRAVVAVIEVATSANDAQHAQACTKCAEDLKHSASLAAARPQIAMLGSNSWATVLSALDALAQPGPRRRAALVFLCEESNASISEDMAMIVDEPTLGKLSDSIVSKARGAKSQLKPADIGWILDKSSFEMLAEQTSTGKIAPELVSVLTIHAGEAGRHPASMDEILRNVAGPDDMQNRLIAENYIYLEDSSPASRVRAYDWLRAQNRAPADFDPLGPIKQRRAALDKASTAPGSQQAPATAPTAASVSNP